jgi:hypothetical protein
MQYKNYRGPTSFWDRKQWNSQRACIIFIIHETKSCTGSDWISWIIKLTAFLLHTHSRTSPEWWDILSHIHDRTSTFLVLPADLYLTEALMVKIKETMDFCHHALTPVPRRSTLPTKTTLFNIIYSLTNVYYASQMTFRGSRSSGYKERCLLGSKTK